MYFSNQRTTQQKDRDAIYRRAIAGDEEAQRILFYEYGYKVLNGLDLEAKFQPAKIEGEHETQKITEGKPVLRAVPEAW